MKQETFCEKRELRTISLIADLGIVGGGLSGVCSAITAARAGVKVVLVQDRPVLGGNASSEIRLWILGATSHLGNNNRWSREGGVIDEILVENTYRNPEGNPVIFDMILLDKVKMESNITLLLNTAVYDLEKRDAETIDHLKAYCSQNSTTYYIRAPFFCDASGDGVIGFLAGAAFRMGAESCAEFGEKMAPSAEYGELLGHSLYFYSKDTGKPVTFVPPSFALQDITEVPRFRNFNSKEFGCKLWWVEYGGRLDTVHDTEKIKWELWKIVYGVWNYIKNSGEFPDAENLTLEWVGAIPGKRESRRFEGDYILSQKDLIEQRHHDDAVAYGGWSIDLHPADGVYSERPGCNQWHSKGIFHIPYRTLYSKNLKNLFLAGRIISVSHVAFGATRVMATSAYVGQAVGMAAKLCIDQNLQPRDLSEGMQLKELQQLLLKSGQFIPGFKVEDNDDLVQHAQIIPSSELLFKGFAAEDKWKPLEMSSAQLLPIEKGKVPVFKTKVKVLKDTVLEVDLKSSERSGNFTPDLNLARKEIVLGKGEYELMLDFDVAVQADAYVFVMFHKNQDVHLGFTEKRVTGVLSVFNLVNKAVSNYGKQMPLPDSGVDEFEFWCPQRRPAGQNLAVEVLKGLPVFCAENIRNGVDRPTTLPNAWVADPVDESPSLALSWDTPQQIARIELWFDTDFDHPMESVLMTHPETVMPFCVRNYSIYDDSGIELAVVKDNYQTCNRITFNKPVQTCRVLIKMEHPSENVPAAVFAVRCYSY
ncbi:FAD-dependent oxidoreductase [Desertivirga xinjiangensis]|uniref:FAD-dependent oxidoreductase n=1 Tax=Desertivirga xinjiangensis TaxID=539206 RepID=UPI0021098330|nr:FAD-dependent oxidoreductase [Pedobacter xinjiangensis]